MRVFKFSLLFFISALFLTACGAAGDERSSIDPNAPDPIQGSVEYSDDNRWARENLDLQAVGDLLEDAETAEEFEYRLNSPENGVNNLDLNGDGYADYISVREFDDRYDDERGFSLFSMFGPEMIQEIATIVFDRDRERDNGDYYPGSRVLITGNEQIYGDNYYYETNWLERRVPLVSWLFTDRDNYYSSPYYYENYPDYYEPYTIVETPAYRTRIAQYYTEPVFIQTSQPTITEIKVKSPYRDKSIDKVYSRLAKPTRGQVEFKKNNPGPPEFVRERKAQKNNDAPIKPEKPFRDKPNKLAREEKFNPAKPEKREKPDKPEQRGNFERQNQVRPEKQKPQKIERQPNFERQKPPQAERRQQMKPPKQENRGNGGGNNKGGGGGNGKGNGGGGGGKKGKG